MTKMLCWLVLTACASGVVASTAAAGTRVAAEKKCGPVTVRGEPYFVRASGTVTCAFARLWTAKLAPLRGKVAVTGRLSIASHPPGFTCRGVPFNEDKFPFQFTGGCNPVKRSLNNFVSTLRIP